MEMMNMGNISAKSRYTSSRMQTPTQGLRPRATSRAGSHTSRRSGADSYTSGRSHDLSQISARSARTGQSSRAVSRQQNFRSPGPASEKSFKDDDSEFSYLQ